jgi:hypothetical protein
MNDHVTHRLLLCLLLLLGHLATPAGAQSQRTSTVGMPVRIEQLVLPGSRLQAKPLDDRRLPIVVRVVDVFPHGSDYRYDLEYYGLDAGDFDLRDYLQREDGSPVDNLPPLPVSIQSLLPEGQVLPHPPASNRLPRLGGYRWAMVIGGALWTLGLTALLLAGRRRRRLALSRQTRPATLAERLEPMVRSAMAGSLSNEQRAELERLLLAFWRRRLDLERCKAAEAMARLRQHPEAGQLLRQLESWLHRPAPPVEVDLAALLAPYRQLTTGGVA